MSQWWPLSQEANKSSGTCSVCLAVRQLHLRDGTVHKHGPRGNPCLGSNKPPLDSHHLHVPSSAPDQPSVSGGDGALGSVPHTADVQSADIWSPADTPIIKHIPKSVRATCASHLTSLLEAVVAQPNIISNWTALFSWANTVLQIPKRAGKRHRLSATIRNRISGFSTTFQSVSSTQFNTLRRQASASALLSQAITAKLEDGNIKAAIRLLNSEEDPAVPSERAAAQLREKHPPASRSTAGLPPPSQFSSVSVTETDVRRAVMTFPAGSAGGPDGLRPQHLRDLILCREAGSELLCSLTAFTNMLLTGGCPADIAPIFFGGRLLALSKKTGGVRPIAIGFTLRRLASKCANAVGSDQLRDYFSPIQLGVGLSSGCEAAVHSARRFLDALPPDHVMVKLDFSNAFNSLQRPEMLQAVAERLPEIYAYCFSAYSQPSVLYFGQYRISSEVGPQQGDPIGPLLFCNTLHPLLCSLESKLKLGYLDDVSLGGPAANVGNDISRIVEEGRELGLVLNTSKCELIAHDDFVPADSLLRSFPRVSIKEADLLGAPLFPGPTLDRAWSDRCAELTRAINRLQSIGSQESLLLLRMSFSAPKVMHLMRCSPSVSHPDLQKFDGLLRTAIDQLTNSSLTDTQWLQASLPIKDGGLGVRRVASLATPAFISSAASSLYLQDIILADCPVPQCHYLQEYSALWSSSFGQLPDPLPVKQSFWDRPGVESDRALVDASLVNSYQRASFLAASAPHSGDWLFALPISSCGLKLDDEAVRIAVGLRLGLNLCVPHVCRCGAQVDARGLHGFVCKHAPGRALRHHALNDVVARAFTSAGIPVTKEPTGLSRTDGKRPDGMTLIPWQAGRPVIWDVTVACTSADHGLCGSNKLLYRR